jgi:hypothetical protein
MNVHEVAEAMVRAAIGHGDDVWGVVISHPPDGNEEVWVEVSSVEAALSLPDKLEGHPVHVTIAEPPIQPEDLGTEK